MGEIEINSDVLPKVRGPRTKLRPFLGKVLYRTVLAKPFSRPWEDGVQGSLEKEDSKSFIHFLSTMISGVNFLRKIKNSY